LPVIFRHDHKTLCEYSDYQGISEIVETIKLLAFEKKMPENEITYEVVE